MILLVCYPRSRLETKGDCAFEVVAPELWKSLALDLRSADTVGAFKKQRKTHLLRPAFVFHVCMYVSALFPL